MTFQAIVTKFIGPTNFRGSRIKAKAFAKSVTIPYDHALNIEDNHMVAAETLATKLGWYGTWYAGGMPEGSGNCYVCAPLDRHDAAFIVEKEEEAA
jgi:hypothetical protein